MVILAIALVVAGAALASLGVLRLTRAAFIALPRALAIAIITTGVAVVTFGALLPRFVGVREDAQIALRPEREDKTTGSLPRADLRGSVRSTGGTGIAGVKLTLVHGADPPRTTTTGPSGDYAFRALAAGGPYRVTASYAGGMFQRVVLLPSAPVSITVAPTTNKPTDVSVRAASIAVVGDERAAQVVYAATVENRGHSAYTGGVPLPVLPGAMGVEPRSGIDRSQLAVQDGVLFSSAPVLPGSTAISYTYVAPMPARGTDIGVDTAFPTSRFDLLVGGKLRAGIRSHSNGTVLLGGRTYTRYTWRQLDAGRSVSARITPVRTTPVLRTAAIAVAGAIAALIVAFPLVRRRRAIAPSSAPVAVGQ